MTLSSTPTAVKAAAKCYVELIVHESDNNVKLVVLDKLMKLQQDHKHDLALQVNIIKQKILLVLWEGGKPLFMVILVVFLPSYYAFSPTRGPP